MSGQTLTDRIAAAQYQLTGSDMARAVCKATTHEVMAPKKKHLDCEYTSPLLCSCCISCRDAVQQAPHTSHACRHMHRHKSHYDWSFVNSLCLNGVWCRNELMQPWWRPLCVSASSKDDGDSGGEGVRQSGRRLSRGTDNSTRFIYLRAHMQ